MIKILSIIDSTINNFKQRWGYFMIWNNSKFNARFNFYLYYIFRLRNSFLFKFIKINLSQYNNFRYTYSLWAIIVIWIKIAYKFQYYSCYGWLMKNSLIAYHLKFYFPFSTTELHLEFSTLTSLVLWDIIFEIVLNGNSYLHLQPISHHGYRTYYNNSEMKI